MDGWWINAVGDQKIKKNRKILEMKKQNNKGFTLVELVIVIAVIAILAGVLIGTFASVISRANQSKAMQEARSEWEEFLVDLDYTNNDEVALATKSFVIKKVISILQLKKANLMQKHTQLKLLLRKLQNQEQKH